MDILCFNDETTANAFQDECASWAKLKTSTTALVAVKKHSVDNTWFVNVDTIKDNCPHSKVEEIIAEYKLGFGATEVSLTEQELINQGYIVVGEQ